ncbi:hypothetical protein AO382_1649 [Moraxella catarrhalis]|uniref:Uncharacterized protein n=1 Tax=Moraxella catarrhalis TaxID=480 RepID=A0A7Z0UXH3_MORCA|nr:hypothetical protein AO382_1649 [Moraxella catarrhalis]
MKFTNYSTNKCYNNAKLWQSNLPILIILASLFLASSILFQYFIIYDNYPIYASRCCAQPK